MYECAYRLVSAGCDSVQLVATSNRRICSFFRLSAVRCSLFGRTFNPEVEGSNPSRPIRFAGFCRSGNADEIQNDVRHRRTSASGCRNWLRPKRPSLRLVAVCALGFCVLGHVLRQAARERHRCVARDDRRGSSSACESLSPAAVAPGAPGLPERRRAPNRDALLERAILTA